MSRIKVTSNKRNRTFTIRVYVNDKEFARYRTITLDKDEFVEMQNNTEDDWRWFLKNNYDYYRVL